MQLKRAILVLALFFGMTSVYAEEMPVYQIVIRKGVISPPTLEAKAGSRIKLQIKNEGPGPSEFENLQLRVEKVLAPGSASFVVMRVPASGSYRFVDEFHPQAPGMWLIVR